MFLLILIVSGLWLWHWKTFTFHNVSINTMIPFQMMQDAINFTFHNVSINTWQRLLLQFWNPSLHSTMFLLILWQLPRANISDITLHSTMFLLIRGSTTGIVTSVSSFTFHNVSINTRDDRARYHRKKTLHSTMFLLILLDSLFCAFGYLLYIPQCFY